MAARRMAVRATELQGRHVLQRKTGSASCTLDRAARLGQKIAEASASEENGCLLNLPSGRA
jgi:hypothetical protein